MSVCVDRDCLATVCVNSCTSLFSGFVIFSYLGYMSARDHKNIDDVAADGISYTITRSLFSSQLSLAVPYHLTTVLNIHDNIARPWLTGCNLHIKTSAYANQIKFTVKLWLVHKNRFSRAAARGIMNF